MNEFLTIYLSSVTGEGGTFDPVLVNLASIVTIEPNPDGRATLFFYSTSKPRTTQDWYVDVVLAIQNRYVITTQN